MTVHFICKTRNPFHSMTDRFIPYWRHPSYTVYTNPSHSELITPIRKMDPSHSEMITPILKMDPSHHEQIYPSHSELITPIRKMDPSHSEMITPILKMDPSHHEQIYPSHHEQIYPIVSLVVNCRLLVSSRKTENQTHQSNSPYSMKFQYSLPYM